MLEPAFEPLINIILLLVLLVLDGVHYHFLSSAIFDNLPHLLLRNRLVFFLLCVNDAIFSVLG